MTNNQFDLNKFNSFLDSASQIISCDSNCQQNKKTEQLKSKYESSQSNLTLAEPQYQLAKKNYYTFVSGESGYNEMIEKEYLDKADIIENEFKTNYELEKNKINTQLDSYDGLLINIQNIIDLYNKYKTENMKLFEQLKDNTNDVLTNDRKTYYEAQQNDRLNIYYYYYLLIIYYIAVICFIIIPSFYSSSMSLTTCVVVSFIFGMLPIISPWILGKIIQLFYFLFNLLPKNVYK